MFNKNKVISKLNGIVGWNQPFDPAMPILSDGNLASSSGYKFDENPFVKIPLIKDTQDYSKINDTDFNALLQNLQNTSIANVLNSVFADSDYIDRQVLYRFANNKINTEILPNGFVGYEIDIDTDKDLAFEISRIILEFQGTGTIKLLLFNSAKSTPIKDQEVTISSSLQEVELNWVIDNTETFYKGKFYLGYLTEGLIVEPYKRDYENANSMSMITNLRLKAVQVIDHSMETLFDLTAIGNTSDTWGLNPDITVYDDYTDLIIQNKNIFAKAIQLQGQIDVISNYLASIRSNRNERISHENVNKMLIELEGLDGEIKVTGLKHKLFGSLAKIKKEIKRLRKGYFATGFQMEFRS